MSDPSRVPSEPKHVGVPRTEVRWPGLIVAVLIALAVSIIGALIVGIFDPSVFDANADDTSNGAALGIQAFGVLGFVLAAVGVTMFANRGGLADALGRLGLRLRGAARVPSTIGLAILLYLASALVISLLLNPQQQDIAESLGADENAALLVTVLAGVLIIPGAAISEELFFRGLMFGAIRQRLPFTWAALISGVIFGLPHLSQGDLAVAAQLSVFGIVLAWAYERSGTLWVTIGLHALNNTAAFAYLLTN